MSTSIVNVCLGATLLYQCVVEDMATSSFSESTMSFSLTTSRTKTTKFVREEWIEVPIYPFNDERME